MSGMLTITRRGCAGESFHREDGRWDDIRLCADKIAQSGVGVELGELEGSEGWYLLEIEHQRPSAAHRLKPTSTIYNSIGTAQGKKTRD